jgi:hypothetical protein
LKPDDGRVEALLTREARAALPMRRQLVLYLDPFALFKDASRGSDWARRHSVVYNYRHRGILLTYLRRWLVIALAFFTAIALGETLVARQPMLIVPIAAVGVGCAIAVAMAAWTSAAYLLLHAQGRRQ